MTHKRPPLWLNTDLNRYLQEQDEPANTSAVAADGSHPHKAVSEDMPPKDRRRANRQLLSGFAVVHTLDPDGRKGRYRVAQLRDISSTGIGLCLNAAEPESFGDGREFDVLFQFSDHGKPIHLACTACRRMLDEAGLIIGAVFRGPVPNFANC